MTFPTFAAIFGGLDKVVIACDERIAAKAAGLDQRPLTRRRWDFFVITW